MKRYLTNWTVLSFAVVLWVGVFSGGCAAPVAVQSAPPAAIASPPQPVLAQPTPAVYRRDSASDGSLWSETSSLSEMFINAKARRVGDIVTIKIVESSKASNQATTSTDRTSNMDVSLTSLFNLETRWSDPNSHFNPFSPLQSTYENDFEGSGSTVRSGDLNAFITARIIQVLPNGNLIIEGNREVRVNHENQIITLTGMVRPRDITSDNVIMSTYIADARISYSGSGIVNDKQRPGWLVRLLDNIWPF